MRNGRVLRGDDVTSYCVNMGRCALSLGDIRARGKSDCECLRELD
jgi:hypothetical protein